MTKVYLDNDVCSAISRRDAAEQELNALDQLLLEHNAGRVVIAFSRQSHREIERAPVQYQAALKAGLSDLELLTDDHKVLGFSTLTDRNGGCICNPLVTDEVDEQLYQDLRALGLRTDDAKHLMYAVHNGCQYFVTLDKHFLARHEAIERRCSTIRVRRPSTLSSEIS